MENPIKIYDLGGKPTIFGNIQLWISQIGNLPQIGMNNKKMFETTT